MLVPWPTVGEIALGRANQTKSNQIKPAGREKVQNSKRTVQNSTFKTLQYAKRAKQG
jgi:hypothetical protein